MLDIRCLFWGSAVLWAAATAVAEERPFAPDAETGLLLHLDGDAVDASGAENRGQIRGPVTWAEGRFGKARSGILAGGCFFCTETSRWQVRSVGFPRDST